jgi:hypothetical protein
MPLLLSGGTGTEPPTQPAGRSKRKASSGAGGAVPAAEAKLVRGRAHGQAALAGQNESFPPAPLFACEPQQAPFTAYTVLRAPAMQRMRFWTWEALH